MAGVSAYAEKLILDWTLKGTGSPPSVWAVGVSLGAPTSVSGSELAAGSGMSRQLLTMVAAASPAGTASNSIAMTFGPSSGGTFSGMQIWDNGTIANGNMIYYGLFATARTLGAGDSLVIAAGALVVSIA